jgi:hypothetical protein
MSIKRFAALALALALSTSAAWARQASPSTPSALTGADAAEAAKALEAKALALLETAVADAEGLRLVENRVRVQASAAGLLWPRDEKAARALFAQAADGVRSLLVPPDPSDPRAHERFQIVWQLRNEMLQAVAQHDPKLALEFLRATRQQPFEQQHYRGGFNRGYKQPDQELALEADLATRVAANDPKEAARIIEEGMRRGLTSNLVNALTQLSQKDPETASRLAAAAIARLRPDDLLNSHDAANVASQLLSMTGVPDPTPTPAAGGRAGAARTPAVNRVVQQRIVVDAEARRSLFETVASALTGSTPDRSGMLQGLLYSLQPLMPEFERLLPARAAALRRRVAEFERTQDPRGRAWREHQHLFRGDMTSDALLEAAAKAPPEIRDDLYSNAAWGLQAEDPERARQAAEKVSDPHRRAQLLQELERQRPWRAAEKGDFELARQLVANLPDADQKAAALVNLARHAAGRDQKKLAREFLEEARALFPPLTQNGQQFGMQLDIAGVYASLDPEESFAIIESQIVRLNELMTAAALVDGFTFNAFREGELSAHNGHIWPEFIRRCAAGLAALAARDFDRATAAARKFERTDARVIAELQLAQHVLSNNLPVNGFGGARVAPVRVMTRVRER